MVGGVDKGIRGVEANRIASSLDISSSPARRTGANLLGDAGRYTSNGGNRTIFVDNALGEADASRVFRMNSVMALTIWFSK